MQDDRFHTYFNKEPKKYIEKSKTELQNSTQNGSIKAQRHSRSRTNIDTKNKKKKWNTDFKLESKLQAR